jgi:hypothetical protein
MIMTKGLFFNSTNSGDEQQQPQWLEVRSTAGRLLCEVAPDNPFVVRFMTPSHVRGEGKTFEEINLLDYLLKARASGTPLSSGPAKDEDP